MKYHPVQVFHFHILVPLAQNLKFSTLQWIKAKKHFVVDFSCVKNKRKFLGFLKLCVPKGPF